MFRIVANETAIDEVMVAGDIFYRILGGVRLHLYATISGMMPIEYEWSTTGDGKYYSSYDQNTVELTGPNLRGVALNEIYWEGDPEVDLDETLTLKLTFSDWGPVTKTWRVKSRVLKAKIPNMTGDDVTMLQSILYVLGLSDKVAYGYAGNLTINGAFTGNAGTKRAVRRFQDHADLTDDGVVGLSALEKINEQFGDYLKAFDFVTTTYPGNSKRVDHLHPNYNDWLVKGANTLQATYTDFIRDSVDTGTSREEILGGWARKEVGNLGHWGHAGRHYRVTLGGADDFGSIGFSQILNKHIYGSASYAEFAGINPYLPQDAIDIFAIFSNANLPSAYGGGNFTRAFVNGAYTGTTSYPAGTYPRINLRDGQAVGNSYTDDNKDLLSKGVQGYNRGAGLTPFLRNNPWPEVLRQQEPWQGTNFGNRSSTYYTLQVQHYAGLAPRVWRWRVEVIRTGANGKTLTAAQGDDVQIIPVWTTGMPLNPNNICISPGPNGVLDTVPVTVPAPEADVFSTFDFDYSEDDWRAGTGNGLQHGSRDAWWTIMDRAIDGAQ
ncbi:MAG: hypothetical protein GKR87_09245 [Kiritimatiellae bacterium]|nr:hypothetical protein [Kiritimatiellia bacterium]